MLLLHQEAAQTAWRSPAESGKSWLFIWKQELRCEAAESDKTKRRPPLPANSTLSAQYKVKRGLSLSPCPAVDLRMNL